MRNDYKRYGLEETRGKRECLKCRKKFMSPDKTRVRICDGCHKTNQAVSSIAEVFSGDVRVAMHRSKAS